MDQETLIALAALWRKILRTDRDKLFGPDAHLLLNRNWGDLIPQPGYVGSKYRPGGLAFVLLHPGGGPEDGLGETDRLQYERLNWLRDSSDHDLVKRFDELMGVLREIMPTWEIVRRCIDPIITGSSLDFSKISYFNLVKWKPSTPNGLNPLYQRSWQDHTGEQARLLNPSVVIAVGKTAGKFLQRHRS